MEILLEELEQCVPFGGSVEGSFDAKQTAEIISRFLEAQPALQRQVFLRRYWFGDSISSIAQRFSINEGTVKSGLFRTREKLKRELEREGVPL